MGQLCTRAFLERRNLAFDHWIAIKKIAVLQEVGFERQNLLHPKRPLLIPRAREAERFVPSRQLHSTGTRILGQRHGEHLK